MGRAAVSQLPRPVPWHSIFREIRGSLFFALAPDLEDVAAHPANILQEHVIYTSCDHPGELATKVGYFGVKSAKVPLGADRHLSR